MATVRLSFSPAPAHVRTARLVAVAVARRAGVADEFLDSTGLGVLVGALKRLRAAGGTLGLVCAHERLLKIFRITALDRVFALFDTVEAATQASGTDPGQTS